MKECPLCGEKHVYRIIEYSTFARMDGTETPYIGITYECDRSPEIPPEVMANINQENARRISETRRSLAGYYTAKEIKAIRKKYHMTVTEFSIVLGIGVASLKRYEANGGRWQSDSTETLLRMLDKRPDCMLICLERWASKIPSERYNDLKTHISEMMKYQ